LTLVVPRFAEMFASMDAPLPITTKIIVNTGFTLQTHWWLIGLSLAFMGSAITYWLRTDTGRKAMDTAVIRLPLFGKIAQSLFTARLARFLGILVESHLPLLDALTLLRHATPNMHYRNLIATAEEAVIRGDPISKGFNDPTLINPAVYQALRSGESSGRIAPSLLQIADFLDEENEVIVRSLGSIIEPLILVALGLMVGFVALSMFTPLFDLTAMSGGGMG